MMVYEFTVFFLLVLEVSAQQFIGRQAIVRTSLGAMAGQEFNFRGQTVYSFQAIPYAQPPIGELRWQPPTLMQPWTSIRSATQFSAPCSQLGNLNSVSSEDCLYLNVFTPTIDSSGRLPIMFWIHGGEFERGSASDYPADGILDNLVTKNVIIVTINYRLGALGLFSLQNSDIVGNYALLDQVAALNWVRTHISSFGGDYRQITVFGQGAGATSAGLLTISPVSQNLIQKVILQSGGATSVHPLADVRNWNVSGHTAVRTGCATVSEWDSRINQMSLASCLRAKSTQEILRASDIRDEVDLEWGPRIDGTFLPSDIKSLLASRVSIPAIIGITSHDGGLREIQRLRQSSNSGFQAGTNNQYLGSFTQDTLKQEVKHMNLRYRDLANVDVVEKLAVALYADAPGELDNTFWFSRTIEARTDALYAGFAYLEAQSFVKRGSPVYLYQFEYLSSTAFLALSNIWRGVVNGWENQYIFGRPGLGFMTQPREGPTARFTTINSDNQMATQMALWWTNFAKYGVPTTTSNLVQWQPMRLGSLGQSANYMSLQPVANTKTIFRPRAVSFWAELVPDLLTGPSLTNTALNECEGYSVGYMVGMYLLLILCIILGFVLLFCVCCPQITKLCTGKKRTFQVNPSSLKY